MLLEVELLEDIRGYFRSFPTLVVDPLDVNSPASVSTPSKPIHLFSISLGRCSTRVHARLPQTRTVLRLLFSCLGAI